MKRVASVSLDLPMAALAALSVAFVLYAMPDYFFAQAIGATGLSRLLPGAEPSGMTARLGVIAAGAIVTFLLIWLVLRALGEGSSRFSDERDEVAPELPRLRRADTHPDAPSRRPLFAGRELGEPFEEPVAETVEPPPLMLVREEPAPVEPIAAEPVVAEPVAAEPEDEEPSIAHLMERLERGLVARQRRNVVELDPEPAPEPEPVPAPPPPAFEDPIDRRLRSALDDLQRLASRGA